MPLTARGSTAQKQFTTYAVQFDIYLWYWWATEVCEILLKVLLNNNGSNDRQHKLETLIDVLQDQTLA